MPFTGAHVAAVLPLGRTGLPFSALAIGSMVPDAYYFLPFPVPAELTHSVLGVFTVDLLTGLAAFVVWHRLLVPPLLDAWPALDGRVRTRYGSTGALSRWVPVAVVLGALTHLWWDTFTHAGRWGTTHVGLLTSTIGPLEGYRWAQYGSGVVGMLIVALAAGQWWHRTSSSLFAGAVPGRPVVLGAAAVLTAAAVAGFGSAALALGPEGLRMALFLGATRGGGAGVVVLLLLATGWHLRGRGGDRDAAPAS